MSKEVVRLHLRDDQALLKFFTKLHSNGINCTREIGFRREYLEQPDRLVLAVTERSTLEQVALVYFSQMTSICRLYGSLSIALIDVLDQLCAQCASKTPEVTKHLFIVHASKQPDFEAIFPLTRLGRFCKQLHTATVIPAGVRPSDPSVWEILGHRLSPEPLCFINAEIEYPK